MKVFVWKRVEQATANEFHPEGGVVVFAETEAQARQLANRRKGCQIKAGEQPDRVDDLLDEAASKQSFVMPDIGCCD